MKASTGIPAAQPEGSSTGPEEGARMNSSLPPAFGPRLLWRATVLILALWTLAVAGSVFWNAHLLRNAMSDAAERDARARTWHIAGAHAGLWALGVLGIFLGARQMRQRLDKQLQTELETQRQANFLRFNPNPILEFSAAGEINYFNDATAEMARALGRENPAQILPPNTAALVRECLATGKPKLRVESQLGPNVISWSFFPVKFNNSVHCYGGDITARKQAELEIQHQATFARFNPNPVLELSAAGEIEYSNDAAGEMARALGRENPAEMLPPNTAAMVRECLDAGKPKLRVETQLGPNVISWSFFPVKFNNMVHCYAGDITERKQAEEDLREREEQFVAMFQLASIGMAQADVRTGQWLRVNDKLCEITGYSADEMLKLRLSEITHPEDRKRDWDAFQRVVRKETPDYRLEKRYLRKDGTSVWVNVNMTVIRDADGLPSRTMATIEDITERKRAEEKLRQLSRAVEQSPASIVITNPAGDIEYVNPKFIEITGYTLAEVLGKNPRILKSGDKSPEAYRELWETITAGNEWSGEFLNKKKNDKLYWESASISPIRDPAGRITHYVAVKEDITARKQAEAIRDQLFQDLQDALANVKALSGLLPICASCKKIRDDKGYWSQVESYIQTHSEATFTHGICPDCVKKLYPDLVKGGLANPTGKTP
jgi:PAS domain S-box-containing protein